MDDHRQASLVYRRTFVRNPAPSVDNAGDGKKSHSTRSTERARRDDRPPQKIKQPFGLTGADLFGLRGCFQFQWGLLIANRRALEDVSLEERNNASQSLILRGVRELVGNQFAIAPTIRAHKNSVFQSEAARRRGDEID